MQQLYSTLYALFAAQAVYVVVLLLKRRANAQPNRILALIIALFGVGALSMLHVVNESWLRSTPGLLYLADPLTALFAPLFYLYTRSLVRRDLRLKNVVPHGLGLVLFVGLTWPLLSLDGPSKLALLDRGSAGDSLRIWMANGLNDLLGLGYFGASLWLVRDHHRALEATYASLEHRQVRWLTILLGTLTGLWGFSCVIRIVGLPLGALVHVALTALLYVIAHFEAAQPELLDVIRCRTELESSLETSLEPSFESRRELGLEPALASGALGALALRDHETHEPPSRSRVSACDEHVSPGPRDLGSSDALETTEADATPDAIRYRKAKLPGERVRALAERITLLFENARPYLEPDFDLPTLATLLDASPHHVSQVLNEHFQRNFYDFANAHRVDEVKRRLSDPARHDEKVLSIGLECGFSSKSTLNAAFKKWTGTTPSAYRKACAAGSADD